jgi:hypothetical protein
MNDKPKDPFKLPHQPIDLSEARARRNGGPDGDLVCVLPVPHDAPAPYEAHPQLGRPTGKWEYRDATGRLLGFALRFRDPAAPDDASKKEFRPLTLWRNVNNQKLSWYWKLWPARRPMFGLDRLATRPDVPVLAVEGEKTAVAAAVLLPNYVAVASPGGAKNASHTDWSPLKGRHVTIVPDRDEPGRAYADDVSRILAEIGAASIAIAEPPAGSDDGFDLADWSAAGFTPDQAEAMIKSAKPVAAAKDAKASADVIDATPHIKKRSKGSSGGGEDDGPKLRQKDQIVGFLSEVELWRDEGGKSFATFDVADHRETWPLSSPQFRRWLSLKTYKASGLAPTGSALEDAVRVADAMSSDGPIKVPLMRVGMHDGDYYLDLADSAWRVVKVTAAGWSVVENSGVPFVRSAAMRPLPLPADGIEEDIHQLLAPFTSNVEPADFPLLVAWLIGALRPRGPYPIAVLNARQDSGKSLSTVLMRSLVDDNAAPIRAAPKDDRDLLVAAVNSHMIALDNMSSVPAWLADALCRLATGGGFSARELHTDASEFVLQAVKPIILNGIPALTNQPDLASRAIILRLKPIADSERLAAEDFETRWALARPKVLGLLMDAMARGFANEGNVKLSDLPRMAGFVRFAVAALPALGVDPDDFLKAYATNRKDIVEQAFESDPVAVAIRAFIQAEAPMGWHGTASELLVKIEDGDRFASFNTMKSSAWPKGVSALGNRLERVAPLLETVGILVTKRHSGARTISIVPRADG